MNLRQASQTAEKLHNAISAGLVKSCHDCSEGGLAAALAESAFAGGLGAEADLEYLPKSGDCTRADTMLFSESCSRYIVEVQDGGYDAFARQMLNVPFAEIGRVTDTGRLVIRNGRAGNVIDAGIDELKQNWQKSLNLG